MFLKNWYRLIALLMGADLGSNIGLINTSGNKITSTTTTNELLDLTKTGDTYRAPTMATVRTSIGTYPGVIFGTGTTPPTTDDYKLSGKIISTISAKATVTTTKANDGNVYTFMGVYEITNTGATAITIGEVALLGGMSSGSATKYLVERTALDEPVTIPPGGVAQVTYAIRMNFHVE